MKELCDYNEYSDYELEKKLNKLYKKKLIICGKIGKGKITNDKGKELFEQINEQYSEIYVLLHNRKMIRYENLINGFR